MGRTAPEVLACCFPFAWQRYLLSSPTLERKKKDCACVDNTTLAKQMALSYLESSGTLCIQHAVWRNWCCLGPSFLPPGLALTFPLLPSSFSAGCVALPALINIKAVIEQRQCTGVWNQKDELPVSAVSYWLLPLLSREERGCNGLYMLILPFNQETLL